MPTSWFAARSGVASVSRPILRLTAPSSVWNSSSIAIDRHREVAALGVQRHGDIDIGQDLKFQRRAWVTQRIGWGVMSVITLIALTGLLGRGPFARATETAAGSGLTVEYPRFDRHRSPQVLRVHLDDPSAIVDDEVRLAFDRSFLEDVEVHAVYPEPDSVLAEGELVVYVFQVSEQAPTTFIFNYLHQGIGPAPATVALDGRAPVDFSHFVYP